jgi:hypothetical protein
MPTKGNPRHAFRFDPGLWDDFQDAASRDPLKRKQAEIVRDLVAWYARKRSTPKPTRPDAPPKSEI